MLMHCALQPPLSPSVRFLSPVGLDLHPGADCAALREMEMEMEMAEEVSGHCRTRCVQRVDFISSAEMTFL